MVYCGKPSKGCQTCREKKVRVSGRLVKTCNAPSSLTIAQCDQLPEGCTQCRQSRRTCPGYRNQLDLMFRNETQHVVRKAKAKSKASSKPAVKRTASAPQELETPDSSIEEVVRPSSGPLAKRRSSDATDWSLSVPRDEQYGLLPHATHLGTGFFISHFVVGQSQNVSGTIWAEKILHTSIEATGLAAFSHIARAPGLMTEARKAYVEAIKLTNNALACPAQCTNDSTLLAVMVLTSFEATVGFERRSLDDWDRHIKGTAALIQARGLRQLQTVTGTRLFMQSVSAMVTSCLRLDTPIPKAIRRDRESSHPRSSLDEVYTEQLERSAEVLAQLQADILASIPQHLGYTASGTNSQASTPSDASSTGFDLPKPTTKLPFERSFLWSHFDNQNQILHPFNETNSELPIIRMFGGYLLPWVLYLAGTMEIATFEQQAWVAKALRDIASSLGVKQALVLASMLEEYSDQLRVAVVIPEPDYP
ncbi:hypothetical protein M8818_006657 [Zalaria obscura]|uniref:Uncharacterized protein n=1 Tax=Zalaria obscura TaxID=2024903 RepID=A0ACC3S6G2_9PEZI